MSLEAHVRVIAEAFVSQRLREYERCGIRVTLVARAELVDAVAQAMQIAIETELQNLERELLPSHER